ncbi:MAG: hypothetical protein ABS76_26375 [Pelagibacterium sp. SCN 64-44]|nr:MAG: hypothetical protein ABS76_26375 [Pelagibacterium sp. SCN 64-44]
MARASSIADMSHLLPEPPAGEWQALRGELVALLDQVEGRYAPAVRGEPELSGLTERVRSLRDQVVGPEPAMRRQEALRSVKRAVDRFSERETPLGQDQDELSHAIAEIRGRQMAAPVLPQGRRASDMPELRELSALVGGLSGRLERLEGELHTSRADKGSVREIASQVEQLTHVVELLAGAVGETGQVKRLEAQIGALAALIEEGSRADLSTLNKRLDDVSLTVGKLAELQAQQMEREILRDDRLDSAGEGLAPAMQAIETSVRNVYDRIDTIEKNVALSSGDFERLTAEMAAFTKAMREREAAPDRLIDRVDALAARIGGFETANGDVEGLKQDIAALQGAVMAGMEPRFLRLESQIEALSERVAPVDTAGVENQLRQLMARMDETGAQLDGLARLYSAKSDPAELEAMATLVAERTSDAVTRKAPAPVAMFGPDSLKSIEDRLTGLLKAAGKAPDFEALADIVAERTSQAVSRSAPAAADPAINVESMNALEERMTALFNTAGKDIAERLARLEAVLSERKDRPNRAAPAEAEPPQERPQVRLESRASARSDRMPANPGDEAPLIDPGFPDIPPAHKPEARAVRAAPRIVEPRSTEANARPAFDPAGIERPPRPQSSFAAGEADPFAPTETPAVTLPAAPAGKSNTSTFVAAARRAQRARQEAAAEPAASSGSIFARALSRARPAKPAETTASAAVEDAVTPEPAAEKPARPARAFLRRKVVETPAEPVFEADLDAVEEALAPGFLTRHRRPLLLAAALVVVSMLALNLVIQRMGAARQQPAPVAQSALETAPSADEVEDVSLVRPEPRIIDMIDGTATGSINPGEPMSFVRHAEATSIPPLPTGFSAVHAQHLPDADVTGSIPANLASAPDTFELPPEAVGPVALRQAAADGDVRAQFEIGAVYTDGKAVPQDYAEAARWYERAAAQGFAPAQYRMGNLYETGQGVEKDLEMARLWYQRGAEAGNRMAMHNLAALYASGQLGNQEFESAAEWFARAAARGMTDSQFNLGMLYARGLGVEQDFEQSYKWFALAARNGDKDAGQARDDIAKSLSAESMGRVSEELTRWAAEPIDLAANFSPIGTWAADFDPGEKISSRDVVGKVQAVLNRLGFSVGTPDGLAGPRTAEAIRAFERGVGMSETGMVNPRLLAVLGSQPV